MSYAERARSYAESVVSGDVPASRWVRLACERHLMDLEAQHGDEFAYRFDTDAAARVCRFVELLPHVKGRWAKKGDSLDLQDWQVFILSVVFGWLDEESGFRRYRRVYIEVPRKNGKSSLTAAVGLYMFAEDDEHMAEVYSGAGSEKQAWEVFGPARLMAKNTPELREHYGISVNAKNLHILADHSKFEPIIGKPGDGASPSFSITDEYHEHNTADQYDTMVTGMGSREQPIAWVITTAGTDTSGPCYDLRSEVTQVLDGTVTDERLFGVIYTIDEEDDWSSDEALRKANPNMGVSVFEDYLFSQQKNAVNNPRKQSTFKTKHLNVWTNAAAPFFNLEGWNRLADEGLSMKGFEGEPCWVGLDLASKLDLTVVMHLFRREREGELHYYAFPRFYLPEERTNDPDLRQYDGWMRDGHLVATPGDMTDYDVIEEDLLDASNRFRIVQVGFDPWNATQVAVHLRDAGMEMVQVPQSTKHLSEPMKEVQGLIKAERIHHSGNPVLSWCMGNVTAQTDRNDNVFPRKERPENKIDGAVALIMAMGRAMTEIEVRNPGWLLN